MATERPAIRVRSCPQCGWTGMPCPECNWDGYPSRDTDQPEAQHRADRHPTIPEDEVVLDWFAGATLDGTPTRESFWDGGEAALAFTDIGLFGGDPRVQLVLYATHHDQSLPGRAISLEIDREDARKLTARLTAWADEADAFKEAQA